MSTAGLRGAGGGDQIPSDNVQNLKVEGTCQI